MREIVMELLREGYVPSWCTACYRKVRGAFFCFGVGDCGKARQSKGGKKKQRKTLSPLFHLFPPFPSPPSPPKGRTGEAFMKIAKAGNIHSFCHPNSLLTLKEWADDYSQASEEEAEMIRKVIEKESASDEISVGAKRLLKRKMSKVEAGERDVYV